MAPEGKEYEALGNVLLAARMDAGLTLRQVGERLNWPHTYVGKVETCVRGIDVIEFIQLARALRVDPAKLLQRVIKATEL